MDLGCWKGRKMGVGSGIRSLHLSCLFFFFFFFFFFHDSTHWRGIECNFPKPALARDSGERESSRERERRGGNKIGRI
jgi:hypothetical protein